MEDGYLGEIRIFAGNFAPRNWAYCNGALLSVAQNSALFAILGTIYGGDGRTTFGLPNLTARTAVGAGNGGSQGLKNIPLGAQFGAETTVLNTSNLPAHNHTASVSSITATGEATVSIPATTEIGNTIEPDNSVILCTGEVERNNNEVHGYSTEAAETNLRPFTAPVAITTAGGSVSVGLTGRGTAFNNIQPSLGVNYIICLQGLFPSRS